jgi:uncharacterized protein Smg (DUF494 family)
VTDLQEQRADRDRLQRELTAVQTQRAELSGQVSVLKAVQQQQQQQQQTTPAATPAPTPAPVPTSPARRAEVR